MDDQQIFVVGILNEEDMTAKHFKIAMEKLFHGEKTSIWYLATFAFVITIYGLGYLLEKQSITCEPVFVLTHWMYLFIIPVLVIYILLACFAPLTGPNTPNDLISNELNNQEKPDTEHGVIPQIIVLNLSASFISLAMLEILSPFANRIFNSTIQFHEQLNLSIILILICLAVASSIIMGLIYFLGLSRFFLEKCFSF